MNYYYESIDRLAKYKINAVVFEFEDKLRFRRQPLVGAPQSISIDEMAALTRYARERHIEITPLVQGLGHATFILKHQEYAGLAGIVLEYMGILSACMKVPTRCFLICTGMPLKPLPVQNIFISEVMRSAILDYVRAASQWLIRKVCSA